MRIGNRDFDVNNKTYVMGILNVTPDSFSDGGNYTDIERALERCGQMIKEGADIIDVGGESTKPGFVPVPADEQIKRVIPVIEKIKANFDIPVSVDTYDAKVAEAALTSGADLINDIYGLKKDPDMAAVIARHKVPCVLMHNRVENPGYTDFAEEYINDLKESLILADHAGIAKDKIILDPGVGFAKDYEQNLWVIRHLEELLFLECPILLGTSRKSVIGLTLDLPVTERLEGTLATTVIGVMKGCAFVRVHDVEANVRAIKMTEAVMG